MVKKIIPTSVKEYLIKRKLTVGKNVNLSKGVRINKHSFFEGNNAVSDHTEFTNSYLGRGSYIATHSVIRYAKIGRFSAIGDNVRTGLGLHPTRVFVSIHPAFFSTAKQAGFTFAKEQLFEEHKYVDADRKYTCEIGNDVWIGSNVLILDGITIGDGAIIAAGTVVTKDVPPYHICGGVPGKLIRKRFEDHEIAELQNISWWEWDFERLQKLSPMFSNIKILIDELNKGNGSQ